MARICREQPLVLGSLSPRRRELLETSGIPLRVHAPQVEGHGDLTSPDRYLEEVVATKLAAVGDIPDAAAILVADTIVVVDGAVSNKPGSDEEGRAMVRAIAGRVHEVKTR